jgi:hypothetical protein
MTHDERMKAIRERAERSTDYYRDPGEGEVAGCDREILLAEVDRLRKALEAIAAKGDECYRTCKGSPYEGKSCRCGEYLGEVAEDALGE